MSTCRELAARLADADSSAKPKLQDKLAAREKSHRDPLKAKEKSLRGKETTPLKDLFALLYQCEKELPEDDSILKRVRASVYSKESHIQETYEAKISKKNVTCRALEEYLAVCDEELGDSASSQSVELLKKIRSMLQSRRQSHRAPLEKEVSEAKSATMKDLAKLRQRALVELGDSDPLTKEVEELESAREGSVKAELVSRFKDMIRDIKKTKSSAIQNFLKECAEELDDNDGLLSQVKSTLENKMLEGKGMKQVHNLDELERGEREKLTDDLPASRGKKSKASDASTVKRKSSKNKSSGDNPSLSTIVSTAVDVASGFKSDLSGAPTTSPLYKLGVVMVFLMYITIVYYSLNLAFKVTKTEVDVTKLTGGFSFPSRAGNAVPLAKSDAPPAAKAAPVAAKASAAASAPADDGPADNGGGGDDDDD